MEPQEPPTNQSRSKLERQPHEKRADLLTRTKLHEEFHCRAVQCLCVHCMGITVIELELYLLVIADQLTYELCIVQQVGKSHLSAAAQFQVVQGKWKRIHVRHAWLPTPTASLSTCQEKVWICEVSASATSFSSKCAKN